MFKFKLSPLYDEFGIRFIYISGQKIQGENFNYLHFSKEKYERIRIIFNLSWTGIFIALGIFHTGFGITYKIPFSMIIDNIWRKLWLNLYKNFTPAQVKYRKELWTEFCDNYNIFGPKFKYNHRRVRILRFHIENIKNYIFTINEFYISIIGLRFYFKYLLKRHKSI